mgnify:CR=1 FL=1
MKLFGKPIFEISFHLKFMSHSLIKVIQTTKTMYLKLKKTSKITSSTFLFNSKSFFTINKSPIINKRENPINYGYFESKYSIALEGYIGKLHNFSEVSLINGVEDIEGYIKLFSSS